MLRAVRHLPRHLDARLQYQRPCVTMATQAGEKDYKFGPWTVHAYEVFAATELSYAFVNLKPVVPGHVLVSPARVVPRFNDLTAAEVTDMWLLAQRVGAAVERHFKASSLTLAIQDGPLAGQTVPHVHIHVLPRRAGDFEKNDEVYDAIDASAKQAVPLLQDKEAGKDSNLDLDKPRVNRTIEEMTAEAKELRAYFT
ncbi:bis-triphosphatase-like protein [Haematococcus lacustris]